jgi:Glycosyl hydrolases family 43
MRFLRSSFSLLAAALLLATAFSIVAAQTKESDAYIFAYFKGNGEDGLHLAYSFDGLAWQTLNNDRSLLRPTVGKDKLMRDPHITLGPDGLFHMVWTSSWTDPVIGYASSKDLINWSEQQAITPMTKEPEARNVWAPETFYDAKTGQYLLFWATTIPGRFPETDETGDNKLNHRLYLTTTKDFKSFTPTTLFYNQGFNVIDATIIRDGSRYLMFLKDETRQPVAKKNLRYATARRAVGPYGPASEPITGNYWAEGPTVVKLGGRWVVYFDKYRDKRYGAVASRDLKSWEDISSQLQFPAGARHGTVLKVSRGVLTRLLELK